MPLLPCCVVFSQTHIGHDKEQGPKEIKNGKGFPHAGNAGCQPMAQHHQHIGRLQADAVGDERAPLQRCPGDLEKHPGKDEQEQGGKLHIADVVGRLHSDPAVDAVGSQEKGQPQKTVVEGCQVKNLGNALSMHGVHRVLVFEKSLKKHAFKCRVTVPCP